MSSFRYETHLHTAPVCRCGIASPEETVDFYRSKRYDGIFVTNHFIDGNLAIDKSAPYEEKIRFFFSDYYAAKRRGDEVGLKVFSGVELSYLGTDFLVYGLYEDWYLAHPEIQDMGKTEELALMRESGALIIQAHPFRDGKLDHIRLYPNSVEGFEAINAAMTPFQNRMAGIYAREYNLLPFAGSDNHRAGGVNKLAGIDTPVNINSVEEFIAVIRSGNYSLFLEDNN